MKALQREQSQRYMTAADMRDDLREYLRAKQEKVDATDIGKVMSQLFEKERLADEALSSSRGGDSGSKSKSGRPSSKSGRSTSSPSQQGVAGVAGLVQRATATTGQHKKVGGGKGLLMALLGVPLLLGGGYGAWRYAHPVLPPPKPPEPIVHVQPIPDPPVKPVVVPEPVKPVPDPVKPDPVKPVVAENPPENPTHKPHTPKEPSGIESTGGFGTLDFDTRPYTEVYLGKKKLGDTPLIGVKVPAGSITVKLVNEDAGIHETYTIAVPKDGRVVKKLKL